MIQAPQHQWNGRMGCQMDYVEKFIISIALIKNLVVLCHFY